MALHDYAEMDESDFYGQGFEKSGVVSVWAGLSNKASDSEDLDVLQDLCGVGYYSLDNQESNCKDFQLVPLTDLLSDLSYVASFQDAAIAAASQLGLGNARWVLAQYDFEYDPRRVKRQIHEDPLFLGVFPYSKVE